MPTPKNERLTENIVRDRLRHLGYYDASDIVVEEQKSAIAGVNRLLKKASKSGKGGVGAPEFIISSSSSPDFLVIIECKASANDQVSLFHKDGLTPDALALEEEPDEQRARRIQRYAVDGALHYAQELSRDYNVIAVAVSGQANDESVIAAYLHPKHGFAPKRLMTKLGEPIRDLLTFEDYISNAEFDPTVQKLRFDELMEFSRDLHNFMRDHAKLTESEKPLVVSGTLIALRNRPFAMSYPAYSPEELQSAWLNVIGDEIRRAQIPNAKKERMVQPYSSIAVHPELGKATKAYPRGILYELISRLDEKVYPFISIYHDFDVVGRFYGEFLKYTGGDKKGLGIVLTPRHVTELFALIANVNKDSTVLDICAGTGGFLISAMMQMMRTSQGAADEERIKSHGLIGVEQQPNMFALAASNMILRGDGKANLYQGSCFDDDIVASVKSHHCDVGLLNPPFSQGDSTLHEFYFIKQLLDCLEKGGTGVIIVPMGCAITPHPIKTAILKEHTLEAVMSMPDELFYPVGTVTCVMVFTAGIPHAYSKRKTWFGYWKNDGFVKTKNRGRIDLFDRWPAIRDRFVETFRNREVHAGESVTRMVTADDEWCAEAYMETDYSTITRADFERTVRNYAIFKLLSSQTAPEDEIDGLHEGNRNG